uniref:Uncharacterized protein n=1 Tax=Periophthalmus magnuspinnatus TaxID=409849 RepID=A0A3B4B0F0_9GOBI
MVILICYVLLYIYKRGGSNIIILSLIFSIYGTSKFVFVTALAVFCFITLSHLLFSINQTDQMLVHLQSFNSIPENYTIPESTKNGVPLFYIPPGSTTPVLSQQHSGSKDSSQSQFAAYWKPILSMDANFWQRWLHMHRIAIILEHDMPVPKHVHTPGSNGRYSTIQCRISHSALTSLLRDCSSFVLVEGYSYVKLIYSSPDQPPSSFYLVRLISKAPCMVLRLGFPIGTPAHIRNKIVDKLKEQILKLRFPHRVQSKEATPKIKRKAVIQQSPSKGPPSAALQPCLSDRPCVVVLNKPLEKLLIRYEKLPLDFRMPYIFSTENCPHPCGGTAPLSVAANRTASSTLASLTRYFLHRRWVWAVQGTQGPTVPIQAVAHILSMLSEIRVSEGFHFAASGEGIVNMVIELPMVKTDTESPSCIVQYIMFPPHSISTKDSFSTDDDNDTELEALDVDSDLSLVTECWVEPQSGSVLPPSEQLRHLQGLQYQQIPQAIFPGDLACMSTMMTFEHLSQLCHKKEQVCSLPPTVQEVTVILSIGEHTSVDDSIHMVPFQFDLMQLLPRCQQVELFFLTFSTGTLYQLPCVPNDLLLSLFHSSLAQELSDREVPLCERDHNALVQHILQRERHGHTPPFCVLILFKCADRLTCVLLWTGVYRSLQQSYSISAQDVLLAMDYCEESLQEMDISAFLYTLCGHVRRFREQPWPQAAFTIGDMEEQCAVSRYRCNLGEGSSIISEWETRSDPLPEFPLSLLQSQSKCEVYPKLHQIIQDQFSKILSQYFKPVPSSPHYFFYCPPSNKEVSGTERRPIEDMVSEAEPATEDEAMCVQTESDSDLLVEYEDQPDPSTQALGSSVSDSNTVNQDDDSFSILEGGSVEGLQLDMPPLFVHITCSVNVKSSHGSVPVQTLPTCLGQVISCLENVELLHSVDLKDLSITLDIFILTLPLEIEVLADFHHNRLVKGALCIRWLLEDEMVSALRSCHRISSDTLLKVVAHVSRSAGRPHCHCEEVPLQFVFGPEQSLAKFKQAPCERSRPSRVQSVVSSQGSLDSDTQGYDGGSSDSECESPTLGERDTQPPLMPHFWLILRVHQDRVKVYSHSRSEEQQPEYLQLHQAVVQKISEICRVVNQRMLLQDLHDSHVCNSLLVAESEEDIWKNEAVYRQRAHTSDDYSTEESYQARDYLAATMQFIPGHFACDVVWRTIIQIHPRLKMGPNMGVSRAIQALRSVLSSFCVVNRKNMFVYQERTTKSVFYLRSEPLLTSLENQHPSQRSMALARSQEPSFSDDLTVNYHNSIVLVQGSRSSLEASRPVGQVDKHILLLVHGVENAGPEITDELVKVLQKRLDETTLDIITVMLVRNCKLTPADVEFIQPLDAAPSEVMVFRLPPYCSAWLPAVAHYLRQNLLIFLHVPKYTDNNTAHHFKHCSAVSNDGADGDIYLYNKPGGQGTGGKGIACITLTFVNGEGSAVPIQGQRTESSVLTFDPEHYEELTTVLKVHSGFNSSGEKPQLYTRFNIWEQGNISPLQLSDKLQGALRHALCDVVMEVQVLPNLLCVGVSCRPAKASREEAKGTGSAPLSPESTTPTSKSTRRSFWDILSKPDSTELGSPKTTDDIVQERGEEGRATRRRHKTETVRQQWGQEKGGLMELEQQRRQLAQLEEGDVGALHPIYQHVCESWITFMTRLGCPSIQQCAAELASHFLLPSFLTEIISLVSSLASDTVVKAFQKTSCSLSGELFLPLSVGQSLVPSLNASRSFILIGRNFHQWHNSTQQVTDWFRLQVALYSYNWSVDLGCTLNRELLRLVHWQNARAHVVHCLLSQKMGLFHHYCFSDTPVHQLDLKQEPNPFLSPSMEPDALLRSAMPPVSSKDQSRLGGMGHSLAPLHFPSELLPFDEALRDVCSIPGLSEGDAVSRHGGQLLDIKAGERRELEKQMKIENLFVTWQQRSAQSNMPISAADLEILKQSSRLVHYCATPLLFDPLFRKNIQEDTSGRDRSYSTDSGDMLPIRLRDEPWLEDVSCSFLQHYVQYLQSMGFILVQVRPQSPARSIARSRAAMLSSMSSEGRMSFSYVKQKSEDSPKTSPSATTHYHLQRALPGGIVLMELAFQGCYFCVKQYALECSRIPMGQSVNSQLSMLFTEECDKVRDLMHVHSFSYDFHLRLCHQYLQGSHMTLRQGYQLTDFLDDFISHHPDIPKFGHNHVFQGSFSMSTGIIPAHQLYNYITDHAGTYGMKPLRMSRAATSSDSKKAPPELHEYALVALWTSSGSYKDLEGLHHHDDFDVSLVVCHNAVPFEEQSDKERHLLRLRFYVLMTSQRELFPRLTADMRRFKKLPQIHKEPEPEQARHLPPLPPLFPLLQNEVSTAQRQMIQSTVEQAMEHCRRDNLWRRLFHGEHVTLDKLKLTKLSFSELEELLGAVQSCSVGDIDPQLCFVANLIKVLLNRFPQSCRHFDECGVQYLAVLNQKFTDCFVLVFLNAQTGNTSLKVVFREPLPVQPPSGGSPPPQLVHMYHHLESIINTACYNLWTGLL